MDKESPSVEDLYQTILARRPLPLPGLEHDVKVKALFRAKRIHEYLLERSDRLDTLCFLCQEKSALESRTRYAYDTPWDKDPKALKFCSDDCADIYMYEEPWAYFWCQQCDREITEQNPMNGWMVQYRTVDDEQICLSCYQDKILEEGLEFEKVKIERGEIPGMFFSYGNLEALNSGYEDLPEFKNYFINTQERADELRRKVMDLMGQGKKVVIGYERLAIGGSEGYVTLMVK